MLCKYIRSLAHYNDINTDNVTAADLEDGFTKNKLTKVLSGTSHGYQRNKSTIVFLDDIDISYMNRSSGNDGKMACALLSAIQGVDTHDASVVRIFTTNEDICALDPAFMRPGRIDKSITLTKPPRELRKRFIQSWESAITQPIGIERFVNYTDGWSFAQMDALKSSIVLDYLETGEWNAEKAINSHQPDTHKKYGNTQQIIGFKQG